jgi:hypothetical protein
MKTTSSIVHSMYQLSVKQVDLINFIFIIVTALVAFRIPFELFLFSYAFLGPLHYLTELSWLHSRRYFTKNRADPVYLWTLTVLSLAAVYLPMAAVLTYMIFGLALIFAVTDTFRIRVVSILGLLATSPIFASNALFQNLFGILLPTIIHVFLFTLIFICAGITKKKTFFGIATVATFILCSSLFFLYIPTNSHYTVGNHIRDIYQNFIGINYALMNPLKHWIAPEFNRSSSYVHYVNHFLFEHPMALALMRFIAFSYTYHYLNWFSKTRIIGWHLIPRTHLVLIIAGWLACVGLYCYNYQLGLVTLLFLSFAHVVMEFPLNHLTALQLAKKFRQTILSP